MADRKKIILVVEDEPPLFGAVQDKLARNGFVILKGKNGKEGLKVALRDHPDLILLNIMMPVMDGINMLKKLRESDEWGKHIPVIILTNLSNDNNKIIGDVSKFKPSCYLVKAECSLKELIAKIREQLGK